MNITTYTAEETKDRYKFPFGKNDKVYRKGLTAIRQRAGQFGYTDVFEAAGNLIEIIDAKENKLIDELIVSMLDDELDEYIDKLITALKLK